MEETDAQKDRISKEKTRKESQLIHRNAYLVSDRLRKKINDGIFFFFLLQEMFCIFLNIILKIER